MRHRKKKATLDRKTGPRKALVKNLAASLVLYEKITTTEAKARVVRSYVERLITKGKKPTLATRRDLMTYLPTQNSVKKILEELSPRYQTRSGGYLRIIKLGQRQGDAAHIARVEFV